MIRVDINPLSVNAAWRGRRRKTDKYKDYEEVMLNLLPDVDAVPEEGSLFILFQWGLSSPAYDWDNPIKCLQDVLQKKYEFDDRRIFRAFVEKEKVKKGDEYIQFLIRSQADVDIVIYDNVEKEILING